MTTLHITTHQIRAARAQIPRSVVQTLYIATALSRAIAPPRGPRPLSPTQWTVAADRQTGRYCQPWLCTRPKQTPARPSCAPCHSTTRRGPQGRLRSPCIPLRRPRWPYGPRSTTPALTTRCSAVTYRLRAGRPSFVSRSLHHVVVTHSHPIGRRPYVSCSPQDQQPTARSHGNTSTRHTFGPDRPPRGCGLLTGVGRRRR